MDKSIKLKKNFKSQTDTIKAFIACSCPAIQCPCNDIYSPNSVNTASLRGLNASRTEYVSYLNR